jgi:hypothetical protein
MTDTIDTAIAAYTDEYGRWGTVKHLPARNGMGTDDWTKAQKAATYTLVRLTDMPENVDKADLLPGNLEAIARDLPDCLSEPGFFRTRAREAMRKALIAAGVSWVPDQMEPPPPPPIASIPAG